MRSPTGAAGTTRGERGALNHLTPARVAAAARLVERGTTITLSQPLETEARIDVPEPADHHMTMLPGGDGFAKDYVGVDYHNDGHSHIDAFSHVVFDGFLFDGSPASFVTAAGARAGTIELLKDGLVGRGVLVDVPRTRGFRGSSPASTSSARISRRPSALRGSVLGPATSSWSARATRGAWRSSGRGTRPDAKAGLHPTAASFLADRRVAALGSDGNNDTAPSTTEGVGFPIHVLALNAMGVHLLDYLHLEDVARHCEAVGRWEFLFAAAPLRIVGGTGSPINPTAIF